MIVSHGKFTILPDQIERARELMMTMVQDTIKEPGCITYDYFESLNNPNTMMLFQEWESIEAINDHFATKHMAEFLKVLPELLAEEVITHRYAIKSDYDLDDFNENQGELEFEFEFDDEPTTLH